MAQGRAQDGIGYAEPDRYLELWRERGRQSGDGRFSLRFALERWQARLPPGALAARIGRRPRCLIAGSASPDNVGLLLDFLAAQGIGRPMIEVVDLIDLAALGRADPRARHHRADAADLQALFADGSMDLVLQDHLLNCAPIAHYDAILREAARVLAPGGAAFLHYTDPSRFPPPAGRALAERVAAGGFTIGPQPGLAGRSAAERLVQTAEGLVMVTLPFGNLESFVPFDDLAARLARAGLVLEARHPVEVIDGEGLTCHRNHCLARRAP